MAFVTEEWPREIWFEMLTKADNRTLAQVAQVSKAFWEMAIIVLYKDIDSAMPLIRLLFMNVAYHLRNGFVSILDSTLVSYLTDLSSDAGDAHHQTSARTAPLYWTTSSELFMDRRFVVCVPGVLRHCGRSNL